jgi:hypothetical protein
MIWWSMAMRGTISVWRVAVLITIVVGVSLAIRRVSGESLPIWLMVCVAVMWFGVGMIEIGHRVRRR